MIFFPSGQAKSETRWAKEDSGEKSRNAGKKRRRKKTRFGGIEDPCRADLYLWQNLGAHTEEKGDSEHGDERLYKHNRDMGDKEGEGCGEEAFIGHGKAQGCEKKRGEKCKKSRYEGRAPKPAWIWKETPEHNEGIVGYYCSRGHGKAVDTEHGYPAVLKENGLKKERTRMAGNAPHPSRMPTRPFPMRWALERPMGT